MSSVRPAEPVPDWADDDSDLMSQDGPPIVDDSTANGSVIDGSDDDDDEIVDMTTPLPEHHCRYCRRSDSLSAVKCGVCKRWFCNTRAGTSGSHIVMHLAHCKHREVSLHADGPLGDTVLECFVCGSKNVFLLGFLPSKEDSVVVVLCREPCLNSHVLQDMEWDTAAWNPIIEERQLLSWIAKASDTSGARDADPRIRSISSTQILSLENKWKIDPAADLDSVLPGRAADLLPDIPVDFVNGDDYRNVFSQHVQAEALTDKENKEKQIFENLTVRWQSGATGGGGGDSSNNADNNSYHLGSKPSLGRKLGVLELPTSDNILREGDDATLWHPSTGFEATVVVLTIQPAASMADEVTIELRPAGITSGHQEPPPASDNANYRLRPNWNQTTYERMQRALRVLESDEMSISAHLYDKIMGKNPEPVRLVCDAPADLNAPNLAPLNPSQHAAVEAVLRQPLSLIQGPPGTGKTTTSATIIYHLCKQHNTQVLVCAPGNVAVDQLCERTASTGLNVVRVVAKSRESIQSSTDKYSLHHLIREFCENTHRYSELAKLFKLKDTVGKLNDSDRRRFGRLCSEVERLILEEADVICATCMACGDARLQPFRFKYVLIDECTHAIEPESIIPLVAGAKQAILVGDHCQMRPVVLSKAADNAGLSRSLFERLVMLGNRPFRLEIQYRMHPCLSEFSSNYFYEGALQNGVCAEERNSSRVFPWPNPRKPMFFYNSLAPEELGPSGTSYLNRAEAALAEKVVTRLLKSGSVTPDQIGVITPYEAQRCYLVNYMQRNGTMPGEAYRRVEVQSVDSFQGREKEFIILTCVRSNDQQGIGFLSEWRRLNVALTRAKRGFVIIGNCRVLARHHLWHALVSHFKEEELIVNGTIDGGLTPVTIALPKVTSHSTRVLEALTKQAQSNQHYLPAFMSEGGGSSIGDQNSLAGLRPMLVPGYGGAAPAASFGPNGAAGQQVQQVQQVDPALFAYTPGEAVSRLKQFAPGGSSSCASSTVDDTESIVSERTATTVS